MFFRSRSLKRRKRSKSWPKRSRERLMGTKVVRSHGFYRARGAILLWGLLLTLTCLPPAPTSAQSQQNSPPHGGRGGTPMPDESVNSRTEIPESMSAQQRQSIMRANFEKSKSDAAELAALAKGL